MIIATTAPPGLSSARSKSHGKNIARMIVNNFLIKSIMPPHTFHYTHSISLI
jgi:hypothetical protein